jgi:outer membrane protein assembly factor BamB
VDFALQALRDDMRTRNTSGILAGFRRLTTADPSVLIARPGKQSFIPLYRVLAEEFEKLPQDTQATLRSTNARQARRELKVAVESGRWHDVLRVAHRFPGSDSASFAHLILAQLHLDRGNQLAAAHWLHALPSGSLSTSAQLVAKQLQSRLSQEPDSSQLPSTDELPPTAGSESASWKVRWRQRPKVNSILHDQIETAQSQAKGDTDTAWNAVVLDTAIYRRSLRGLTAMDVRTGTIQWSLRLRPCPMDQLSQSANRSRADGSSNSVLPEQVRQLLIQDGVRNRISTGKDAVYLVTAAPGHEGIVAARMGQMATRPDAHLVAVSRRDGRRRWSVGGQDSGIDNQLADVWFAGPPLVDGESLHSVVQRGNEIRLMTLRANTGEVPGSTLLAFSDDSIERDPARRLVAATPVAAKGLLLCSTTTGWIVAVDHLTRTVVWATRTSRGGNQNSRNPSPGSALHVLGGTVAVIPWNSEGVHFVDIVSGTKRPLFQRLQRPGVLALINDDLIIATSDRNIERIDASTTRSVWQRALTPEDGLPCGAGIVMDNKLLLAMTTGAISSFDVSTGEVLESSADVLRPARHGMLLKASAGAAGSTDGVSDDVLFIGPVETICLTKESVSETPKELVSLLLTAGDLPAAWEALNRMPSKTFSTDPHAAGMRFEIAFELAENGQLPTGVSLEALATGSRQRVQASAFRIAQQSNTDPLAAAHKAIDLLKLNDESVPAGTVRPLLPASLLPSQTPTSNEVSATIHQQHSSISLRTWAALLIENALQQSSSARRHGLEQRLRELSVETLLQIDDPLVVDAIQLQLGKSVDAEHSLQMRLHLNAISQDPTVPRPNEMPGLPDTATTSRDASRRQYLQMLLSIVWTPSHQNQSSQGNSADQVDSNAPFIDRSSWWDSWDRTDYLTIPFVRRNPAHRHPYRLHVSRPNDSFLRQFDLLIHRDPPRLVVREVAPSRQWLWSIPGSFPARPGLAAVPTIERSGSLLLIQAVDGVTAVSLLEQRVLWQIRADPETNDARTGSTRRMSPRIVSTGPRWVCLQTGQLIEMVDALTGESSWSCPVASSDTVWASENCVIVHDQGNRTLVALDRRSGQQLHHHFSPADVRHIVSTSGTEFVMQQQDAEEPHTTTIVWQNALTGKISRTVTVDDVAHIRQNEGCQTVIVHTDSRLSVVDLQTARVREYHWSADAQTDVSQSAAGRETGSQHDWPPDRIRFFEDSAYVYLIHQADTALQGVRVPEREFTRFRAMRVFERHSGELLWETSLPKSQYGSVVTDQLTLPFVATLDQAIPNRPGQRDGRVRLRCFRKSDGHPFIEQFLPSRYSYDEFRLSAAEDYSVSAQIHGTHIRFELPETPSVRRPADVPDGIRPR